MANKVVDLEVVHHDGRREVLKAVENWDVKEYIEDMKDPSVTHIAIGDHLYHKGSIKSVVKAESVKK